MKITIQITVLLTLTITLSFFCQTANAINVMDDNNSEVINLKNGGGLPRSIEETPYCYYYNGVVYIEGDENVNGYSVTITCMESNYQWHNFSNRNKLSVFVSTEQGTYYVEVYSSSGIYYYGEYILQ